MRRLLLLTGAIVFVDTMFFAALTPLLPHYVDELDMSKASAGVDRDCDSSARGLDEQLCRP